MKTPDLGPQCSIQRAVNHVTGTVNVPDTLLTSGFSVIPNDDPLARPLGSICE